MRRMKGEKLIDLAAESGMSPGGLSLRLKSIELRSNKEFQRQLKKIFKQLNAHLTAAKNILDEWGDRILDD